MPAGDGSLGIGLRPIERQRLQRAVHYAEQASGARFSVYVGVAEEDSRAYARRLHGALPDPDRTVLIVCDPAFRALEIVTGTGVMRQIDDVACGLAVATMKSCFVSGEVIQGLITGIQQLGEAGRRAPMMHGRS